MKKLAILAFAVSVLSVAAAGAHKAPTINQALLAGGPPIPLCPMETCPPQPVGK